MDLFRLTWIALVLVLPSVTGILFQSSLNNINLGDPQSDLVTLTCSMSVTDNPVKDAIFIKIFMESTSGSGWEQVAIIVGTEDASLSPTLPTNIRTIMEVSGTLVDDPATSSQLVVSMNASLMTCLHARRYRCELSYLYGENFDLRNEDQNITLSAIASPSTPRIETVKNLNTNQVINVANGDTSTLTIQQNEELEIVCSANIGSNDNTIIQWEYSSSSGSGMIGYNGYKENGEAQADNSGGTATNCRYTRTSTIRHNISDIDAARGSSNPLIFSCYIQAGGVRTQNNPMYTVTISGSSDGDTGGSVGNAGTANAGAIAGGVVGGLAFVVIVTLLVYFLWYRRRSTGDDYKTKEEYGADNPNMAPADYAVPDKNKKKRQQSTDGEDSDDPLKPTPKPRAPPRNELHYAELDLAKHPPTAPRRKHQEPVEYAEVEFKKDQKEISSRRGHENRGLDEPHESNSRNKGHHHNDRGRANYGMDKEYDDYDSRDGSPTFDNDEINHMGVDPIHGSIGTGV